MDTTITTDNPEGAENTAQDPEPTAEGGAIAKQPIQPVQVDTDINEDNEQTQTAQPAQNIIRDDMDTPQGVPGEIALDMIEEQNLKKQEDRELFHAPVIKVSQDDFVNIHIKTRRALQDVTGSMTNTKTVQDSYMQAKARLPLLSKVLMEDILPPHAYTWHVRNALAFKAAIGYLKKDNKTITGATDERTLHRLILSQARMHENMYKTGGMPQNNAQPQPASTLGKYGPHGNYTCLLYTSPSPRD